MTDPDETIEAGFGDVIAGEVYSHEETRLQPDIAPLEIRSQPVTATVTTEPPCDNSIAAVPAPLPPSTSPPPASSGLTSAGVQAAKALVRLPDLTFSELARLAREMAMDLRERHVILKEFKLDQTGYDFLEANNEFYISALKAACKEWHAPLSTQERIKVEAAAILEDSLIGLGARMQNKGEGLPGVIEAAKLFAKVAGVGEREAGAVAPGERFTINIDLGGDTKIAVEAQTHPAPPSGGDPIG